MGGEHERPALMVLATRRLYRTPTLQALSFRFAVRSDDDDLGRHVDGLLRGLRDGDSGADVEHWYTLCTQPDGIDVWRDDESVVRGVTRAAVAGWVVWDINRSAVEASGEHLLFHAAALEIHGAGLLLPGASGSGKSTLTAALASSGAGYLSDELVALDLASGALVPYPKPISLKSGSFALLAHLGPVEADEGDASGATFWGEREWQVAVGERAGLPLGRPCPPRVVVAPRYRPGAPTVAHAMTETEAFFSVAAHAVNLTAHGARGTAALADLAASCPCASLTFSDLDDACRAIGEWMGTRAR
jgi:hypothetical protein